MDAFFPLRHLHRVYCAGPLFNEAERQEMNQIAAVLRRAGFEPFVPHADGMEFAQVHPFLVARGCDPAEVGQLLHAAVFALDLYQVLAGCGSVVFNMNGRVPDEGAVAEAAMAWTLGKVVVLFKEDARSMIAGRDNPLLAGMTEFHVETDLAGLGAALARRIAEHPLGADWQTRLPPHLLRPLQQGERLWNRLQELGDDRPPGPVAEMIGEIFGPARDRTRHREPLSA
ncbi:MAG TPA: nucleoside 2-deoxyribosyltransferase [Pirellulales bacterium]|jgi:nucleoside 2-deoxyribosyltransferase|nr:nucleoside 2-deoxyribosyltransferase [Pirellulales bacterium]